MTTHKAGTLLEYVERKLDLAAGQLPDGGWLQGGPDSPVSRLAILWKLNASLLGTALADGADFIVFHEWPFWNERRDPDLYRMPGPYQGPETWPQHPDHQLRQLIEQSNATFLQIHYGLDRLCIYDAFAKHLSLGPVVQGARYECVYALPQPRTVAELADDIAGRLDLKPLRVVGNPHRQISRVGNCWGGVGLSANLYFIRRALQLGAELIVAGEMDEMTMNFLADCNAAGIETGHYASEAIGLQQFAQTASQTIYPGLPARFYPNASPLHWLNTYPK